MPPLGGPVYQPTTVSYEPPCRRSGGSGTGGGLLGPASSLRADSPLRVFRKPKPQIALLVFALISLTAGVAMLASGTADLLEEEKELKQIKATEMGSTHSMDGEEWIAMDSDDIERKANETEDKEQEQSSVLTSGHGYEDLPLGILGGGIFMVCLGFVAMGVYLKVADWRRKFGICPCRFFDKKQSLARTLQLQCQSAGNCGGQGINALNPSSDPLVTHTQYAPVSDLPSLRAEDEERRNLMPDSKDCLSSAEELDPDPRILLRPMNEVR